MTKKITVVGLLILLVGLGASIFLWQKTDPASNRDSDDLPKHEADSGCVWTKRVFSMKGISFFEQDCPPGRNPSWVYSEDSEGRVIQAISGDEQKLVTMELFTKDKNLSSLDVVKKEWYEKLTPEQQSKCEIQNADRPILYLATGASYWTEEPHPMIHKVRYKIDLKPEVAQGIMEKNGHMPGSQYNFLCGETVGSHFSSHPPYFEFDDRSPDKYLFVRSFGFDGPLIDLNSIRF